MRPRRLVGLLVLFLVLIAPAAAVQAAGRGLAPTEPARVAQQSGTSPRPARSALAGEFMCQCGCGLTVASCTHASCAPRDQMLAEIARLEAVGKTDDEIRAVFVAAYGEAVLAAPPRRGFNLVAWWGPYAALLAGAVALVLLGAAWARRPQDRAARGASPLTPEQQALLQRELDRFKD